jgi:hypothetical protein
MLKPYKVCKDCRVEKPASQFSICKQRQGNYLASYCKPCVAQRMKRWKAREPELHRANRARYREKAKPRTAWYTYQMGARKRGLTFDLPRRQFDDLITDNCCYCGSSPEPINGIDRVDNKRGYESDNVVTCCSKCNEWKRADGLYAFLERARAIANHWVGY